VATTRDCPFKLDSTDAGVPCSKTSCTMWSASRGECAWVVLVKAALERLTELEKPTDYRVVDP
jgi:hypothetical protein